MERERGRRLVPASARVDPRETSRGSDERLVAYQSVRNPRPLNVIGFTVTPSAASSHWMHSQRKEPVNGL